MRWISTILIFWASLASAATITCDTCEADEVISKYLTTSDGDTLEIPAGTCVWTTNLFATNSITIKGAGTNQTIIYAELPKIGTPANQREGAIVLWTKEDWPYKVQDLTFRNLGTNQPSEFFNGIIQARGESKAIRLTNLRFENIVSNRCMTLWGDTYGVVDNVFAHTDGVQFAHVKNDTFGGLTGGFGAWTNASPIGTTNCWVFEDYFLTNSGGGGPFDCHDGGWMVSRHGTILGQRMQANHGTDSIGNARGAKGFETYFVSVYDDGSLPAAFAPRSGSGVIFSNTFVTPNYTDMINLTIYRMFHSFTYWGGADGTNGYDTNNATGLFDSGTHTGSSGATSLTDSGQSWTPNEWTGYTLQNTTQNLFSMCLSNTATTIYYLEDDFGSQDMTFDTGDAYEIYKVEVIIDQCGRGKGDLISGTPPPTPIDWPDQIIEGIYEWGNTFNGGDGDINWPYTFLLTEGTDYFDDTQKPGYTPLVYPHPMVTAQDSPVTAVRSATFRNSRGRGVFQ